MAAQNEGGSHVIAERVHQKSGARRETAAPISAASFENRETGLTASSLKRIAQQRSRQPIAAPWTQVWTQTDASPASTNYTEHDSKSCRLRHRGGPSFG